MLLLLNVLPIDWHGHSWQRALWLLLLVVAGAGAYFATLLALGLRPRQFMRRTV